MPRSLGQPDKFWLNRGQTQGQPPGNVVNSWLLMRPASHSLGTARGPWIPGLAQSYRR